MSYDFADRLIEMRRTRGLSQEELAKELGLSRQAISKWERAESAPDIGNLVALSEIYEVSLDELVHGVKTGENVIPLAGDAASNAVSQDDEEVTSENEVDSGFVEDGEEIVLKAEVLPMDEDSAELAHAAQAAESAGSTIASPDPFAINDKTASTSDEPVFDTAAFFEEIEQDRIAGQSSGGSASSFADASAFQGESNKAPAEAQAATSQTTVFDNAQTVQASESQTGQAAPSQAATSGEAQNAPTASSQASPHAASTEGESSTASAPSPHAGTVEGAPTASTASQQTTPPPPQEGTVWVMDSAEVPVHPIEKQKNPMLTFPYPVLIVLIYLVLGFGLGLWHPAWVLFLTIPFYYWIVNVIAHDPEYLRRHGKDPE